MSLLVSLWTTGETNITVGKAIQKANNHALSQIDTMLSTIPTLNREITNDIKPDMKSAIKKANTIVRNFGWIIEKNL